VGGSSLEWGGDFARNGEKAPHREEVASLAGMQKSSKST
jgi:hypothetical protein